MTTEKLYYVIVCLFVFVAGMCGCGKEADSSIVDDPEIPNDGNQVSDVNFYPGVEFVTTSPGMDMVAADLDGNGIKEIVIPQLGTGVKVLWNVSIPGIIAFNVNSPQVQTGHAQDVDCGDLNGDDLLDLYVLNNNGMLEIYLQDVSGEFSLFSSYPTSGEQILVDEVNSTDVTPDVLVAKNTFTQVETLLFVPGTYETYKADGTTTVIGGIHNTPSNGTYVEMVLADFEANGIGDIIALDAGNRIMQLFNHVVVINTGMYYNPLTGEYETQLPGVFYGYKHKLYSYTEYELPVLGSSQYPILPDPLRADTADFNADGINDICVLCSYAGYTPDLPQYLTDTSALSTPCTVLWLCELDINGAYDGDISWQTDDTAYREVSLTNRCGLTFPNHINDVKLADIDKDGNADVLGICDGPGLGGSAFFYYTGLGNFTFEPPVAYNVDQPPFRLLAEDFDGDTYIDIAVLMPTTNVISIYRNDGGTLQGLAGVQYAFE